MTVVAVKFDVNAGINFFVEYGLISWDVGLPFLGIVADEVVDLACLPVYCDYFRVWIGVEERELDIIGGIRLLRFARNESTAGQT